MFKKLLLVFDVDGVLAKNKTYDEYGRVISKTFIDSDFTYLKIFKTLGHSVVWLSGDYFNARIAVNRKIDFHYVAGQIRKDKFFNRLLDQYNVEPQNFVYVGDDIFDIPLLKLCKLSFCPANSPIEVRNACGYVLKTKGGEGIVREMYDVLYGKGLVEPIDIEKLIMLDAEEK